MGTAPDQRLLDRIQHGDEAAFDTLVDRHYASLSNVAQLYLGAEGNAYEAIQAAWLRALDEVSALDRCSSLRVWLTRILIEEARTRATDGEPCDLLGLDGSEERALLHGARSRVRCAAEEFLQSSSHPAFATAA